MPITVGHMKHVKNLLLKIQKKRVEGLPSKQLQCMEETTADVDKILVYVEKRIEEA